MVFDNITNKIKGKIDRNTMKTYDHNNDNSSNNFRRFKFINLAINDRLSYFKQLTKAIIMIQSFFDNIEIGNVLGTTFR